MTWLLTELDYNVYALLDTFVLVQAMTLGSLLILMNKKKYKSTVFLGLLLVLFAFEMIPTILENLNVYSQYPKLYLLPFDFFWLHFPLFYLYCKHICIYSAYKKHYWVLYPGIVIFFLQLTVFFLSYETKLGITENFGYDIYRFTKIIYGLSIGIFTFTLLLQHKRKVQNSFSMIDNKEFTWARIFLIYDISGYGVYTIIDNTIGENVFSKGSLMLFNLILVYWVSYHGILQRNVLTFLTEKDSDFIQNKLPIVLPLKIMTNVGMEELMKRLDGYLIQSEGFVRTDLTIMDLARKLKVHPKRISTTINTLQNLNFNTYINQFRVKKAEKLLIGDEVSNLSIDGIGNQVGFHSKSAFYSAFKKVTGTTPLRYKKLQAV